MAHLGYLHSIRTFSRCCNSLASNCCVKHMVLALYVRVLITLYLAVDCGDYPIGGIDQCW